MWSGADRELAARAEATFGITTLELARSAGLSERQIASRRVGPWTLLYEGVYRLPGVPSSWEGSLLAATLAAGPPVAISHRSAAALYQFPGGRRDLVELTCQRWDRTKHPGPVVHESRRLMPADIGAIGGIPVTTPERTLLDLAWLRPNPNYLEAVIHAARRKRLITYESALTVFTRHARRGLRGVTALRIALDRWDPNQRPTDSEMETMLLQALRRHGLPEPVLQYEIHDERGLFVARVEGAWPRWRACFDYDSNQEHMDEFQLARDAARRNRITATGWAHFMARHVDLKRGGAELAEQLQTFARLSA